jgi:hypothetical protein
MGARPLALALACSAAVSLAACAPARETATVSLRLRGEPRGASVTVDDIPVGSLEVVAARGVALPRGVHYVTVVAPGYLPFDRRVVAEDAPVLLDVKLVPIPD